MKTSQATIEAVKKGLPLDESERSNIVDDLFALAGREAAWNARLDEISTTRDDSTPRIDAFEKGTEP